MECLKGQVSWFNNKLGYGFINSERVDNDIYVHYTDIKVNGYKTLYENDIVEFIYDEEKNKALEVIIIKKASDIKRLAENIKCEELV